MYPNDLKFSIVIYNIIFKRYLHKFQYDFNSFELIMFLYVKNSTFF